MNLNNLHEILNRYDSHMEHLYFERGELRKWKATKTWQENWNTDRPFIERFKEATKDCGILLDYGKMHIRQGVIKLHGIEPETIEDLFEKTLFKASSNVNEIQNNMDSFIDGYNAVLESYFPKCYFFKIDRYAASNFLSYNNPQLDYMFRYKKAAAMAKYIGFGEEIGTGKLFKLANYYRMCDIIVDAIKEHSSLLERHFSMLSDDCYRDESLHLLAFDIMYTSEYMGFYSDLIIPDVGKKKIKTVKKEEPIENTALLNEIEKLEVELEGVESELEEFDVIPLIGVNVNSQDYGDGIIVAQNNDKISVKYANKTVEYKMSNQFKRRYSFENDTETIEYFTEYGQLVEKQKKIKQKLELKKKLL